MCRWGGIRGFRNLHSNGHTRYQRQELTNSAGNAVDEKLRKAENL